MRILFPSSYLKINNNVRPGDHIRFLDAGINTSTDKDKPKYEFSVAVLRDGVEVDQKKFSLNKTNATTMTESFGDDSAQWVGKEMVVNVIKVRNPSNGKLVDSIVLTSELPTIEE